MSDLANRVQAALSLVIDPELRRPITELDMVGAIQGSEDNFSVEIKLTVSHCPQAVQIEQQVTEALSKKFTSSEIQVKMSVMTPEELDALKV